MHFSLFLHQEMDKYGVCVRCISLLTTRDSFLKISWYYVQRTRRDYFILKYIISNTVGRLIEVGPFQSGNGRRRAFLQIKVSIDIYSPLLPGFGEE